MAPRSPQAAAVLGHVHLLAYRLGNSLQSRSRHHASHDAEHGGGGGVRVVCAALLATVLLAGCSAVSNYAIVAKSPPPTVTPCTAVRHQAGIYVGVSMPGFPPSAAAITKFEHTTDVRPNLIEFYSRFGDSFDASAACYAVMHGAMPVIQIDPDNTP